MNQSLARRLWADGNAVGKRIYWGGTTGRTRTVIGVTGDFQDVQLDVGGGPMLFVPHAQVDLPGMTILLRTPLQAASIAPALRDVLRTLDPSLPAPEVHSVDASRSSAAAGPRFNAARLAAFAGIAFVLAVTGVYAMLAFTAIERRRELAIWMGLGAGGGEITGLVLRRGLAIGAIGTVLGLLLAAATSQVLRSLLFEVGPTDALTFAAAAAILLVAVATACYLPARRAGRLDPLTVLRD